MTSHLTALQYSFSSLSTSNASSQEVPFLCYSNSVSYLNLLEEFVKPYLNANFTNLDALQILALQLQNWEQV
jgi:hypothetical protein